MVHTEDSLLEEAAAIRDERQEEANTAPRVGQMHQHTVEALFEQTRYEDSTPTGVAFGSIPAGTNLAGLSVLRIISDAVKAPFRPATVALAGGGIYEKGLVQGVDVALAGSITPNNDTILNRRLKRGNSVINSPATNALNFSDAGLKVSAIYTLEADTQASGTKVSGEVRAELVAPTYYGTVGSIAPTEAEVKALNKEVWEPGTRAVTYTNDNQRVGFFEPKSSGRRVLIRDQNGYNVTADFTYSEALFTLPDGTQEAYSCYVLTDAAGVGTPFTYTFFH